jgi:hypothetical protein
MVKVEVLEKAIAAHARWKARLRAAASSGKFDADRHGEGRQPVRVRKMAVRLRAFGC